MISFRNFLAPRFLAIFSSMMLLLSVHTQLHAEEEYLEPTAAFAFSAAMLDGHTVGVTFRIAKGYYMYRERLKFAITGAKLGTVQLPAGKVKFDETFQKDVETYRDQLQIKIPVEGNGPFTLTVTSQGCADAGLCYSPMDSTAKLVATGAAKSSATSSANETPAVVTASAPALASAQSSSEPSNVSAAGEKKNPSASVAAANNTTKAACSTAAKGGDSDSSGVESALKGGKLLAILPLFWGIGLALAFTPCVLPMVPILSFIIVGEGAMVSRLRGFTLSLAYVLGMSIIYTLLGVASGLAGEGLTAALQNPWVLGAFGLLLVALSLAMFDVYQLQMPASIQEKLISTSERQRGGKLFGVFLMGAISALIVGPCVTAPLVGTLVYISKTGDAFLGGSALFAMAIGMGTPLLLMGLSAGSLLPKAGMWMDAVKKFFGVLLLAVALWLVSPILPGAVQMIAWATLLIGYGVFLLRSKGGNIAKLVGVAVLLLGAVQGVGVASGSRDPLAPLDHFDAAPAGEAVHFQRIKTVAELDQILAANQGKRVMLDFYADWCVSCKEMEKLTFPKPEVKQRMSQMLLLQVDVTANDAADKEMLKRFHLFGPPGIIFFDCNGRELEKQRVVGYQNAQRFARSLDAAM